MSRHNFVVFPSLQRILTELGDNIRLARLRRRISSTLLAERAGISRNTLRAIEQGNSNVTFAAYANVLLSLQLEQDLRLIARDDELGRKLQDAGLTTKMRAPKRRRKNTSGSTDKAR